MDEELKRLVADSVCGALIGAPRDVRGVLASFGWEELVLTDEGFAVTTLFEELGRRALDTNALEVVTASALALDDGVAVIWPLGPWDSASGTIAATTTVEGVVLGSLAGPTLALSGGEGFWLFEASSISEEPLGGMAEGTAWRRVRAEGAVGDRLPDPLLVERRYRLALASELVGVAEATIGLAVTHVSAREQFGQPVGAYQAVRFRLAEAYTEMVGARALVAAAWEDGSLDATVLAHAVASATGDAVAKHALQVCGAIGYSAEHALPGLVRRSFSLAALVPTASVGQIGAGLDPEATPIGTF